ncbi:hypothetical protein RJ640_030230 [Escallonia rubra]|uniref:Amine oxidase n=1 Tax=Escallonia rubra TaxID=112253 RepID=A0AA88RII8_9ASTE|nr:hypothetical protein RJ640_030230 [Escallonia rubra]
MAATEEKATHSRFDSAASVRREATAEVAQDWSLPPVSDRRGGVDDQLPVKKAAVPSVILPEPSSTASAKDGQDPTFSSTFLRIGNNYPSLTATRLPIPVLVIVFRITMLFVFVGIPVMLRAQTSHPLDPLSAAEISVAVATVRAAGATPEVRDGMRFVEVVLSEPDKNVVALADAYFFPPFQPSLLPRTKGGAVIPTKLPPRRARLVVYNKKSNETSIWIVELSEVHAATRGGHHRGKVISSQVVRDVQPPMDAVEYAECEAVVKDYPPFREAMKKRGIEDMDLVMVDAWCLGYHSEADAPSHRLAKPLIFCRTESDCPMENGYARPVEGIYVLVDMQNMVVIEFEDRKLVPLPPADPLRNYTPGETRGGVDRSDIKPLHISQPEGPSFRVNGHYIEWQKWNFRIGFTPREGLVIHSVAYVDGSRGRRPIAHRLSFVEMVVPYGDPNDPHYRKNAFDAGEDGLGKNAHSLKKDGKIEAEVKLTGILSLGALQPGEFRKYGTTIAPGLYAPVHQHFFVARMDMAVDCKPGEAYNQVVEVDVKVEEPGKNNVHNNAFYTEETLLKSELVAMRDINPLSARHWIVRNTRTVNRTGQLTGYKLVPGSNCLPLAGSEAKFLRRAAFLKHNLWVTPYARDENFPGGEFPNQNPRVGEGLASWVKKNRSLEETDVVLWYVFGITHVPRLEDWPVMPVEHIGFMLQPHGFFNSSPAIDVPPGASSNDPILAWVWSYVAAVQMGQLRDRIDAATELASLARDNDRNKKIIVDEGGIGPLLKLLKEGASPEAQIAAATALYNIGTDQEGVRIIASKLAVPIVLQVLGDSPMSVQVAVVNLVARMAEMDGGVQEELGRENVVRPLVTILAMDVALDDPKGQSGPPPSIHSVIQIKKEMTRNSFGNSFSSSDGSSRGGNHRKEKEVESPEVKLRLKIGCSAALWKLARKSLLNSRKITETKALLCLAKLIEKERGELRVNCMMTVMELAAVAESNTDLRRSAFKPNSPAARAVLDQLLGLLKDESSGALLVYAIRSIGSLARTFPAKETRIIGPLVAQLGHRNADVATEAAIALGKFVCPENFNRVEHSKTILEFDGVPLLIKLLRSNDRSQKHELVLLCYLALNVGNSKALEQARALNIIEGAARSVVAQHPDLRELFARAIHHLTLYQAGAHPHRQPYAP